MKRALLVLPTYNERENIVSLIPKIFEQQEKIDNWQLLVLVVDDRSPDNTAKIVTKLKEKYKNLFLIEGKKLGLGKAYQRGFSYGIDKFNPAVIIEMDADWSHDPNDIPRFLEAIDSGADFVIGSRYIKGGSIPSNWGLHRKIFSYCGNLTIRLGFMKISIHDWTNGYRAMSADFLKNTLKKYSKLDGYIFQIGVLDTAIKHHIRIKEIPVHFKNRVRGVSKINSPQFISNIFLYILTNSTFVRFAYVGLTGAVIDFGLSFLFIEKLFFPVWLSTVISAETAIISNFILNNFWSFAHKQIKFNLNAYLKGFAKFNAISIGSILIQTTLLHYATESLGVELWYIYKAAIIFLIIIPYSYILYNKIIWRGGKT